MNLLVGFLVCWTSTVKYFQVHNCVHNNNPVHFLGQNCILVCSLSFLIANLEFAWCNPVLNIYFKVHVGFWNHINLYIFAKRNYNLSIFFRAYNPFQLVSHRSEAILHILNLRSTIHFRSLNVWLLRLNHISRNLIKLLHLLHQFFILSCCDLWDLSLIVFFSRILIFLNFFK